MHLRVLTCSIQFVAIYIASVLEITRQMLFHCFVKTYLECMISLCKVSHALWAFASTEPWTVLNHGLYSTVVSMNVCSGGLLPLPTPQQSVI